MTNDRIFVALGANLTSTEFGTPRAAVEAALAVLTRAGLRVVKRSRWFESAPVPISDQPWYVNGVVEIATDLDPHEVLARLHAIETEFGRVRVRRNEARVLDLDLLAHGGTTVAEEGGLVLPHPRLAERAFVLLPLADIAPDWRHPATGLDVRQMIANLPPGQVVRPLP